MPCTHHFETHDGLVTCVRCGRDFCPSCHVLVGGLPYCGTCKEQLVRDLRSGRPASGVPIASIGRRFVAMVVDGLVLAVPIWILFGAVVMFEATSLGNAVTPDAIESLIAFSGFVGQILILLVSLVAGFLYEWLMLSRYGRTLGKMAMRLKVVTPQGNPISGGQAAGRAAIKQVFAFLSCFGLVNYLPAFFTAEATAVHDMVANCRVIEWEGDET